MKNYLNRKQFSLLFLLALVTEFNAQTLTASNFTPVVGEIFNYSANAGFSMTTGAAGKKGILWDYSSVSATQEFQYHDITANHQSSVIPTANYAKKITNAYQTAYYYEYFNTDVTGINFVGTDKGDNLVNVFPNSELIMPLPMSFGMTAFDTYTNYSGTGSTTLVADGTGTLITCFNTYTNVLRVHSSIKWQSNFIYLEEKYSWYVPGVHSAVFSLKAGSNGQFPTNYVALIYQDPLVFSSLGEVSTVENNYLIFPSPIEDKLRIKNVEETDEKFQVTISNTFGEVVKNVLNQSSQTELDLDVSDLAAGIYLVDVSSNGNLACRKKIVKY